MARIPRGCKKASNNFGFLGPGLNKLEIDGRTIVDEGGPGLQVAALD